MKLIDVFPDALTGSGIFDALNTYNVPWKTDISSISLDLEYFGNVSGDKTVSPLICKLSVNGVLSSSAIAKIAQSLYNMHGLRWTKLWNTYQLEYDPIQNYNMTEIMSDDDTVTTYGRTHSKTGTEVDDRTRTDDNKESVYGFNSSAASDSDESDRTINDDNTHTYNVSDTDTGSDRQSHSYELTRSGNIGVTTSQQMIESERALWMWRYFYDVVFPDVDKMLTIAVYSCDEVITESGGATPTGTINITSNGNYDVTEYANAAVNVPNTYSESDNGMVVYNGELVSQIGREISENGTYDTTLNNAIMVDVSNSYTAADEGKVVNNGALTVQGSRTITENGTYDTTLISELTANVPGVTTITRAEWNALTTAQKRSYGMTAIIDYLNGFKRGDYVNGADYLNATLVESGTGSVSASVEISDSGNYQLIVIAMNSEAATKTLQISAQKTGGVSLVENTIKYNEYINSGVDKRNYRISTFEVDAESGDEIAISLTNQGSHAAFVYALISGVVRNVEKTLTTPDGVTSGSYDSDSIVVYGTFDNNTGGTINLSFYNNGDSIQTANPGNNYKSSYIFWLS